MSSPASSDSSSSGGFSLYHYYPNKGAAGAFVALFTISALTHLYKLLRYRVWYFVPFIVGLIFEAVGYLGRNISAGQSPNWTTGPYILQSLTLLLGPTLLAASIYMTLGRLIRLLHAGMYSLIRTRWLTKVFLFGDIFSFFIQSAGGGMLAKAETKSAIDLGENIITGGLIFQVIFFGFFMIVTCVFHRRIVRAPTPTSLTIAIPWQRFLYVLYAASIIIMVRSVFRVAEFASGFSGPLQSSEAYIYIFDATLMFITSGLFIFWHPGSIVVPESKGSIPLSDNVSYSYRETYP
ncbi:RTA1 like domain-containing protein [Trichoderma evansii]